MDSTLYGLAQKCKNEIRLVGTLSELDLDSYEKNGVLVVKYKGVVQCDNAFISIKSTMTNYDATVVEFIRQFNNENVIGSKVYIIGKLTNNGVACTYMTLTDPLKSDCLCGTIKGIIINDDNIIVVDNEHHRELNINNITKPTDNNFWLTDIRLKLNNIVVNEKGIIINDGSPAIIADSSTYIEIVDSMLVEQAQEEHEIYLEAMRG